MSHSITIPKVKILGFVLANLNKEQTVYSKYYTKHFSTAFISKIEYNFDDPKSRRKFQGDLIRKAKKINDLARMNEKDTEIFTFQQFTTIFKVINHLQVYLIFDNEENTILMETVIDCLFEVMKMITTDSYEGKNIFTHLEDIILAIDQMVDQGIFVTIDPQVVFSRLKMKEGVDGVSSPTQKTQPAVQQSGGGFSSLFGFAKNSLQKTLNMG